MDWFVCSSDTETDTESTDSSERTTASKCNYRQTGSGEHSLDDVL